MNKRHHIHTIGIGILILLMLVLIFIFSAQNAVDSAELSKGVTRFLVRLFTPGFDELPGKEQNALIYKWHDFTRKAAHFTEFAVLSFLFIQFCGCFRSIRFPWLISGIASVAAAAGDEIHQIISAGRGPSVMDVGIDSCGVLIGILLGMFILYINRRFIEKRQ